MGNIISAEPEMRSLSAAEWFSESLQADIGCPTFFALLRLTFWLPRGSFSLQQK
jgi:hypothetical protein